MKVKIVLNGADSAVFYNFRKNFISKLISADNEVYVICYDSAMKDKLLALGVKNVITVRMKNTSVNIFGINKYKKILTKHIREINPDIVISFMLKPAIYGSVAAQKCGIKNIYAMIEGMGRVFTSDSIMHKIMRTYVQIQFKKAFKNISRLFVLNQNDSDYFASKNLIEKDKIFLLNGIGVNVNEFSFAEIPDNDVFLMVARLIEEKGVYIFCEAAEAVKLQYPDVRFCLLGPEDSIKKADLQKYPSVEYLGTTDNVAEILDQCSVFVLPSYYKEGLPRSIMEAMAKGRPIITTDTNGCKDMVEEGVNGYIVPVKNIEKLVEAIKKLAGDKETQRKMGLVGREMAEKKYDSDIINDIFYSQISIK